MVDDGVNVISPAEFSRLIGVSKAAVSKAIKVGRVPIYDAAGIRVGVDYTGRRFVRPDEAKSAFTLSRARIDDATVAEVTAELDRELTGDEATPPEAVSDVSPRIGQSLASAKTQKEELQSELLRMRLARERGELITRAAQLDAFETAGRAVARQIQTLWTFAEEINGIAHTGGAPALAAWLRAKADALCNDLANVMAEEPDEDDADDADDDIAAEGDQS